MEVWNDFKKKNRGGLEANAEENGRRGPLIYA
jgi:hypothetical protein